MPEKQKKKGIKGREYYQHVSKKGLQRTVKKYPNRNINEDVYKWLKNEKLLNEIENDNMPFPHNGLIKYLKD